MTDAQQTICLCMIVKNEHHVITRCLDSVRPFIDTWVIVDTGSTDGTQDLIRTHLSNLPGELFERPWVDFAHNRSESLALARRRADYVLVIDADEHLHFDPAFKLPPLDADGYMFTMRSGGLTYYKTQLVRDALDWHFVGVIHEYIFADRAVTYKILPGLETIRITDGARSRDPLTYRRDALLLEDALLRDPGNARHMFYLAQSYSDAREPVLAIDRYQRRIAMGGWIEETWYSFYRIAALKQHLNLPWPEILTAYLAAYSFKPNRAEPLFQIGFHYQQQKDYPLAYLFFSRAIEIPYPKTDLLYVEHQVYEVLLPLEYSVACFWVGRHREAIETANQMLAGPTLTPELAERFIQNRAFSLDALYPPKPSATHKTAKILICIMMEDDILSLQTIESLRAQDKEDFEVLLIENGPAFQPDSPAPELEAKLLRKHIPEKRSWAACLSLAAEAARPDDILLLMHPTDQLLAPNSLTQLAAHFQTYDCTLAYGQFQWSDGSRGNATPLASAEDLDDLDAQSWDSRPLVPLAFRASLLSESTLPVAATPLSLLERAGFARTRFNDQPILIRQIDRNTSSTPS